MQGKIDERMNDCGRLRYIFYALTISRLNLMVVIVICDKYSGEHLFLLENYISVNAIILPNEKNRDNYVQMIGISKKLLVIKNMLVKHTLNSSDNEEK